MGGILLLVAALILLDSTIARAAAWERPFSAREFTWRGVVAIGSFQLVVGALMGLTSIGSGSLVILSMVYLFRMTTREIVGSNIAIALIMVVPAGLTHYLAGGVDWWLLGSLLVGSTVGAVLGARSALRVPDRALSRLMAGLIAAGALSTIVKAL